MKNKMKAFITILIIVFIIIEGKKLSIKKYTISYKKNQYQIKEYYQKEKEHTYYFIISNKKNRYIYSLEHNFHKKKKVIKELKSYKSNNLNCIIPIYKKNIQTNLYCSLNQEQVSIDYLIKNKNPDFLTIQKKIKKYQISYPSSNETPSKYKKLTIYQKNILKDDIYYIWNYKGIDIISNNNMTTKKFLKEDLYDNILVTTTKNYYVLLDNSSVEGITKIYYYNNKNDKLITYKPETIISKDCYINGIMNDLIYITDKKEKKQYTLNIKKEKIERIDQDETSYMIYDNNKKKILSKSDFFMKEQYFTNNNIENRKITSSKELKKDNNKYYYLEDNKMYQSYQMNPTHKVLLFELNDIKEWYIKNHKIIILQNDTVYSYQDSTGLRKILKSNELKYNYKNIYQIGEK